MTNSTDIVERLRSAYEKVALWPEKRMAPGAVEGLGIGFNELLELRNLVPEAADLIQSQQALIEEMREALKPFAEAAESLDDDHRDGSPIWEAPAAMGIDAIHLRRAKALSQKGQIDG